MEEKTGQGEGGNVSVIGKSLAAVVTSPGNRMHILYRRYNSARAQIGCFSASDSPAEFAQSRIREERRYATFDSAESPWGRGRTFLDKRARYLGGGGERGGVICFSLSNLTGFISEFEILGI